MRAATYPEKSFAASHLTSSTTAKPERGLWGRMLDRVIATRTEQAERELARYLAGRPERPLV